VGRVRTGHGTTDAGSQELTKVLRELNQPLGGAALVDGSGLAPQNRVTCPLLVSVLDRPGTGPQLVAHLPVAGVSGTLRKRFVGTPVVGRLKAKTGTLLQVTSIAGVIDPSQGGSLTFAYVANVAPPGRVSLETVALQDQLATILLGYPRAPALSLLGPKPLPGG
jgi:D-alanyl-D-alanine carboxypeptidase/D-alanyl-D-alanine-endopeptidase (penicillin-binding protein 4)